MTTKQLGLIFFEGGINTKWNSSHL